MTTARYLEHERMATVKAESQAIGEFLEWLGEQGVHLAKYQIVEGYRDQLLFPVYKPINQWLADYFGIDLNRVEDEKRAMLAVIREANA